MDLSKEKLISITAKVIGDAPSLFQEIYSEAATSQQDLLMKESFELGVGKAMVYFIQLLNEKSNGRF